MFELYKGVLIMKLKEMINVIVGVAKSIKSVVWIKQFPNLQFQQYEN